MVTGQRYGSAVLDYGVGGVKEIRRADKSNVTGNGGERYCLTGFTGFGQDLHVNRGDQLLTRRSFESSGPVQNDRHRRAGGRLDGCAHQETLTVGGWCVTIRKSCLHAALEKFSRDAAFKLTLGPDVNGH